MLRYPVKLQREGRRVLVSFPDVTGIHTFGADRREALARAGDALETMFMGMISDREDIAVRRERPILRRTAGIDGGENPAVSDDEGP